MKVLNYFVPNKFGAPAKTILFNSCLEVDFHSIFKTDFTICNLMIQRYGKI